MTRGGGRKKKGSASPSTIPPSKYSKISWRMMVYIYKLQLGKSLECSDNYIAVALEPSYYHSGMSPGNLGTYTIVK